MQISRELLNTMAKPVFVAGPDGRILFLNEHGSLMVNKLLYCETVDTVKSLDPDFTGLLSSNHVRKEILFQYLKILVDIFNIEYEGVPAALYIFDNILFNEEVDSILNSIGYVINVLTPDGAIESLNNAAYTILGITHEDSAPGHNLIHHYEEKTTCVTEPTYLTAMREKKSIVNRIEYKTGVVLLNRATPIYEKNGSIKRVVVIGEDVSETAALDEMLLVSGKANDVPTLIHLNEISEYFSRENYVVASDQMKQIVNKVIKIAASNSSVFIWGESGVGKEMIAKLIHYASPRKDMPFITINCAAIPSELMESEFFGYEQGAFTGASRMGKKGLLEDANGGTVFLDELGMLPYAMQGKLLRAIQENKIRRVGGNHDIPIDVRYVSATNLTVKQFMDGTVFREDLYYRLSVVPINIPPLRHRREDIVPLINHFMHLYNEQMGKTVMLSKKALRLLINHNWPGNIRELKNTIERSVLLAEKDLIELEEMQGILDMDLQRENMENLEQSVNVYGIIPMSKAYDEVFDSLVRKAYAETGSIVKTAEKLEINPSTIHRKIKQGKLVLPSNEA